MRFQNTFHGIVDDSICSRHINCFSIVLKTLFENGYKCLDNILARSLNWWIVGVLLVRVRF
jgi:hypothetical protein